MSEPIEEDSIHPFFESSKRNAPTYICFVAEEGSNKSIHRHSVQADTKLAAAEHMLEHCTLSLQTDRLEVEIFVHAGSLFHLELVETEAKP